MWRWLHRKRRALPRDSDAVVQRFSGPDPQFTGRFRLAQYTTTEKTDKYRQAFGIQIPALDPSAAHTPEDEVVSEAHIERPHQPTSRRVRYRIYEDGGEVPDIDEGVNREDDDSVISLPPIYSTVARSPSS